MFVRGENTEPSEYLFDGFSYAFELIGSDGGNVCTLFFPAKGERAQGLR